jgi:uncharacterized protein YbjT (DUF2867 family)
MSESAPLDGRKAVFVTGATGYIGCALTAVLLRRGHRVRGLVRQGLAHRLPAGATAVFGNALDGASFVQALTPDDVVVHLVGTPHPNPRKAAGFIRVDLASISATAQAARSAGVRHVVYVSVAQPAPVMQAYVEARAAGERALADASVRATVARPWYVLGEGHRWPVVLTPVYALAARVPATRGAALRLGLVTLDDMVRALVHAVETPAPTTTRILDVPAIRRAAAETRLAW